MLARYSAILELVVAGEVSASGWSLLKRTAEILDEAAATVATRALWRRALLNMMTEISQNPDGCDGSQ